MTPEEKAPYEKKAKDWKQQQKGQPRAGRLDCTGQLIDVSNIFQKHLQFKNKASF